MTLRVATRPFEVSTPRGVAAPAPRPQAARTRPVDGFEEAPRRSQGVALQRGMTGAGVRALQQKLVARGYLSRADMATGAGVFGPRTEAAVKRFQQAMALPVTGAATTATLAALAEKAKAFIDETPTDRISAAAVSARLADTLTDDFTPPPGPALRATGT